MAKGAQDWVARTDILLQTLAELIYRPRLGTICIAEVSGYVAANTENLVLGVSGAGMHFGTYFWADSTGVMDNDYLKLVVDGTAIALPTFGTFNERNFIMGSPGYAFGTIYDTVNFKTGGCGDAIGYTWNNSFLMYYVETHGRNPFANLKFIYSLF